MADEATNVPPPPQGPAEAAAPKAGPAVVYTWGTGRRKTAVARVRIRPGSGKITINAREMEKFFMSPRDQESVRSPLAAANLTSNYDVWANVTGGGTTGQAYAVMLGLARALMKAAPELASALRDRGLLTRDARMKERKKYGQKGARKRFQFSKR